MPKEWQTRLVLTIVAIAAFWTGRWVNIVDDAIAQVHKQEVRIVLLEQISEQQKQMVKQQLDANKKFTEALDDFRRVVAARR